ncbi:MAG: hypothetical protein JXB42_10565 [Deltaproteobacteria bacterium]|nr:hypothetical protein [Deltaproteobacteria bacterium]
MKKLVLIITVALAIIAPTVEAIATTKVVMSEGRSFFNMEDATRQAQRAAVEKAVGVFVHSQTEVENFVIQKDKIMSRTQGYITRVTVLEERDKTDEFYVKIEAEVSLDKIKDDLVAMRILLDSMEHPTVMVLVEEEYSNMSGSEMNIAETEITSLLASKGFDLVDKAQLDELKRLNQAKLALTGNIAAAKSLGLDLGAQYVVIGKAAVQDIGEAYPGSGLKSLQASLQLKLIQTNTGRVLGSVVKNGVSAHISPVTGASQALRISSQKAVDEYLIDTITKSFQEYLNNGAPVKIYITGVRTFEEYSIIASNIETLDRVVSSKKEAWNKAGALLILDLKFKGTSEELAELLDGARFGNKRLEVTDFGPDRVDFDFL